MVQEADMTRESLRDVTQEERRQREYISITRAALDAANEEVSEAKAAATVTQAELPSKLDSSFFGIYSI
jgi:predicted  nucleic acid-binding Zn-ribbon protein